VSAAGSRETPGRTIAARLREEAERCRTMAELLPPGQDIGEWPRFAERIEEIAGGLDRMSEEVRFRVERVDGVTCISSPDMPLFACHADPAAAWIEVVTEMAGLFLAAGTDEAGGGGSALAVKGRGGRGWFRLPRLLRRTPQLPPFWLAWFGIAWSGIAVAFASGATRP